MELYFLNPRYFTSPFSPWKEEPVLSMRWEEITVLSCLQTQKLNTKSTCKVQDSIQQEGFPYCNLEGLSIPTIVKKCLKDSKVLNWQQVQCGENPIPITFSFLNKNTIYFFLTFFGGSVIHKFLSHAFSFQVIPNFHKILSISILLKIPFLHHYHNYLVINTCSICMEFSVVFFLKFLFWLTDGYR